MKCPDCNYPKLKIHVSELILDSYEYISTATSQFTALFDLN